MKYDKIILGAGLYGLYAALYCGSRKQKVLVLEYDDAPFKRATYINQARVHQGYHYPRSVSTAMKSAGYFERFNRDFDFCINREFKKVYATSSSYSWTDAAQFKAFCRAAGIPCEELHPGQFFKPGMCDGAFLTREYTYDAMILRDYFTSKLADLPNVEIQYGVRVAAIERSGDSFRIATEAGVSHEAPFVLNATYAASNQVAGLLLAGKAAPAGEAPSASGSSSSDAPAGEDAGAAVPAEGLSGGCPASGRPSDSSLFGIKYELCEIILCDASPALGEYGFTVMDGPFFSIMPFGKTGLHSLTSVTFTPHSTSYDSVPSFACQKASGGFCSPSRLGNCNDCPAKPQTAFPYMANLARKYLKDDFAFSYRSSLFSMKPILKSSEIDDSRPTVIRRLSTNPTFISVLSGKINTVYDLDEVLDGQ
ncbi:MAG: FAD-binding oxidoreductase [Treponema sp.]|nr:FAD-binding oxidoreductase [Treponema sp.]